MFVSRLHQKITFANIVHTSFHFTLSLTDKQNRTFADKITSTYKGFCLAGTMVRDVKTPSTYHSFWQADEVLKLWIMPLWKKT